MVAHAGIEAIWILIVIGSAIAQAMKAANARKQMRGSSGKTPTTAKPKTLSSTDDDLRDFLEQLSGGPKPQAPATPAPEPRRPVAQSVRPITPTPPAPEPVVPPVQRRRPGVPARQHDAPAPIPVQHVTPVSVKPASQPKHVEPVAATARRRRSGDQGTGVMRRLIRAELRDRNAIRRGIILRDILGSPVALRHVGTPDHA